MSSSAEEVGGATEEMGAVVDAEVLKTPTAPIKSEGDIAFDGDRYLGDPAEDIAVMGDCRIEGTYSRFMPVATTGSEEIVSW